MPTLEHAEQHEADEFRLLVRRFVDEQVIPTVRERDHSGEYAGDLLEKMCGLGLPALPIDPDYGGLGVDIAVSAAVFEELGRGWVALADMLSPHFTASKVLGTFGSDEQKAAYLPKMATGDELGAIALTEPVAGSDLRKVELRADADGDSFVVTGTKTMITHAAHARTILTLGQVRDADAGGAGLGVVILRPGEDPGLSTHGRIEKLGHRGVDLGEVICDGARIPRDRLLGSAGDGLRQVMSAVNEGRILVGAGALGMGTRALELATEHTRQRSAFGSRLADLPVVRDRLGSMWIKLASARALLAEACRAAHSEDRSERIMTAAAAKVAASDAGSELALTAMQLHGGYGYTKDYDIERIYRDVPLTTIGEGSNDLLRQTIAGGLIG